MAPRQVYTNACTLQRRRAERQLTIVALLAPAHACHSIVIAATRATPTLLPMNRWCAPVAMALLGAGLGVACGSAAPAPTSALDEAPSTPLRSRGAAFGAERLLGDVSLEGIPLGSVQIQVCPGDEPNRFGMVSRIVPASLLRMVRRLGGRLQSVLSSLDGTPLETQVEVYDGDETRSYRLRYHAGGFDFEYLRRAHAQPRVGTRQLPVEAPINDMHSALLLLRSWRPRLGESAQFFVALGRDLWRVDVRAAGPEMLQVQGAPALTRRVDGDARRISASEGSDPADTRRSFSLWFSDGPEALPARLEASANYGEVAMSLTGHDRSTEGCSAEPPAP